MAGRKKKQTQVELLFLMCALCRRWWFRLLLLLSIFKAKIPSHQLFSRIARRVSITLLRIIHSVRLFATHRHTSHFATGKWAFSSISFCSVKCEFCRIAEYILNCTRATFHFICHYISILFQITTFKCTFVHRTPTYISFVVWITSCGSSLCTSFDCWSAISVFLLPFFLKVLFTAFKMNENGESKKKLAKARKKNWYKSHLMRFTYII